MNSGVVHLDLTRHTRVRMSISTRVARRRPCMCTYVRVRSKVNTLAHDVIALTTHAIVSAALAYVRTYVYVRCVADASLRLRPFVKFKKHCCTAFCEGFLSRKF